MIQSTSRRRLLIPLTMLVVGVVGVPGCSLFGLDEDDDYEIPDENGAPRVNIETPLAGAVFTEGQPVTFTATVIDPEDGQLVGAALRWSTDLSGTLGTGTPLTVPLVRGVHRVTLTATDSDGAVITDSRSVTALPSAYGGSNGAPTVTITEPQPLQVFKFPAPPLLLVGSAIDPEEGALAGPALRWESHGRLVTMDLGTGTRVDAANLPVGWHRVRLVATDSYGATGFAIVSTPTLVYQTEACALGNLAVSPGPLQVGVGATANAAVTLTSTTPSWVQVRLEDGVDPVSSAFASHVFDVVYGGETARQLDFAVRNDLSVGDRFSVQLAGYFYDFDDPFACRIPLDVEIVAGTNAAPAVAITSPGGGQTFGLGQTVTFQGSATDTEDGALGGASLVWTSDRDGQLGTGTSFSRADLSAGPHAVTLAASDSQGATGSATVAINITSSQAGAIQGVVRAGGFGFPGITVTLTGARNSTTVTGQNGVYSFPGLLPGSYTVTISNWPTYLLFTTSSQTVTLGQGQTVTVDFDGTIG